jgi:hypothetical protein
MSLTGLLFVVSMAAGQAAPEAPGAPIRDSPLQVIPDRGAVPPIIAIMRETDPAELARRAAAREYGRRIRLMRHRYFDGMKDTGRRHQGIAELRAFTDPVAFMPLVEELKGERDDVRLALLEHLAGAGPEGQPALAWMAIDEGADPGLRQEAARRVSSPPTEEVLAVLDRGLRSPRHDVANAAGSLAGSVNALATIPLLIFAQVTRDEPQGQGDLAWIAVQTQRAYVQRVDAVVGNGAAGFFPVPGIVTEGAILRVVDAVVVIYRTEVHQALVSMTSRDWGRPTESLGYDIPRWFAWYNQEYVPFKNERLREALLDGEERGAVER